MLLLFVGLPTLVQCFLPIAELNTVRQHAVTSDPGEALFVTPYLDTKERIAQVRKKAQVDPFAGDVKSYAGYFTVHKKHNSNLFFWFFPSEQRPADDPVVLWLHGGPGQSSLRALFHENGPYIVEEDGVVLRNQTSWTKRFNVLYVDSPVGAGYSFTDHTDGYSRTVRDAAQNLYEALKQFFAMFSEYKANAFVLSGQSYAGKYIPVLAKLIHEKNEDEATKVHINLKRLFIGCGFINPAKQIRYADFFYQNGIIDAHNRDSIQCREQSAREAIEQNKYYVATYHLSIIAAKLVFAGYRPPLDVQQPSIDLSNYADAEKFIQKGETRAAIHVGCQKFQGNAKVVWYFREDFYKSVSEELSAMLSHYKVLLYAGQSDMIIPPSQIDQAVASLTWNQLTDFRRAECTPWYVKGELAGYAKSYSNLRQVLVRQSNHMIIGSQPVWLFDLVTQFCQNL